MLFNSSASFQLLFSFCLSLISYPDLVLTAALLFCRARAIRFRQDNNEAVGGFFSQIGQLYMVHHLWGKFVFSAFFSWNQPLKGCLFCPGEKVFTKGKGMS